MFHHIDDRGQCIDEAVHGRMPLILQEDQIEDWLRDGKVTEEILRQVPMELVRTAKYEQMTLFPM